MLDYDKEICYCNNKDMQECAALIKEHDAKTMDEIVERCGLGDKCEACHEDGYQNDGYSLAMVLSLVKQNRL